MIPSTLRISKLQVVVDTLGVDTQILSVLIHLEDFLRFPQEPEIMQLQLFV